MEERGPNLLWPDITLELVVIRFHQIQSTVVQAHRRQGWENGGSKPGMESANWKQEVKMSDLQGISIFFLLSKSPSIQDCLGGFRPNGEELLQGNFGLRRKIPANFQSMQKACSWQPLLPLFILILKMSSDLRSGVTVGKERSATSVMWPLLTG